MGFTTGLLGGFTLTTALLYFSISSHARNRAQQSSLLQQQSLILASSIDKQNKQPTSPDRQVRAGLLEEAKDRWNRELESGVRRLYETDWHGLRERAEDSISNLWSRGLEKGRESLPKPEK